MSVKPKPKKRRKPSVPPRKARSDEQKFFINKLSELLTRTQERVTKVNSGEYELRVMTVEEHDVVAHSRKSFEKVYLAKLNPKRKPSRSGVNPVASAIKKAKPRSAATA